MDTTQPAKMDTTQPAKMDTTQPGKADKTQMAKMDTSQPTKMDKFKELTQERVYSIVDYQFLDDNVELPPSIIGNRTPKNDLATLETLPLEIIQMILVDIDISTLMTFHQVNARAAQVIEGIPEYKVIASYAPKAIPAIVSAGLGHRISCVAFYHKLCTAHCENCGDFGGFIYLLTCTRVCHICLSHNDDYLPMLRNHAVLQFGITWSKIRTLPQMTSVPGRYTIHGYKRSQRITLVDSKAARDAAIARHGSHAAMTQYLSHRLQAEAQKYQITRAFFGVARRRMALIDDLKDSNPLRYMAVIRAPLWEKSTQTAQWGRHCKACLRPPNGLNKYLRQFSKESFEAHLNECGPIRHGKHQVEEQTD
ncbi:hypothetical protein IQ07DRAFT_652365 [Pyrenochaeta sp. DS3sAY3a]|nr:hypothetical protein IQ07DRAFT_652365 [Pyrenochaeta sp. DS3sAY3a]